ncbi:unnamed protein product [Prorocentrum cordatum]|uniref:Uncharacterized protein n=1 Tax=Prorocentrum cordatum TaxID=2364126 RepID=A0ABN9VZ70_9DINO|nr:unnamed protein product [Polarella glacialis]
MEIVEVAPMQRRSALTECRCVLVQRRCRKSQQDGAGDSRELPQEISWAGAGRLPLAWRAGRARGGVGGVARGVQCQAQAIRVDLRQSMFARVFLRFPSFAGLLPMVKRMSTRDDGLLSVYKVCAHNCFDQEQVHSLRPDELQPLDGQGSLNTTWDFGFGAGGSGVDLIDDFHRQVDSSLRDCDAVSLNRRLYLIHLFQHYVTSYHQDTHVPPHFTIYNQVCGYSVFHFLPLLVGLYVTHVGRAGPLELQRVLGELDRRGVGSLGTLGPDRVALITPFGSHGVWVPSVAHNPSLRPFEVSLIRAAELYARPVLDRTRQALRGGRWNHAVEPTAAEQAQARAFAAAQERICEDLGLTRSEWALLARETWEAWSQDSDEEQERCQ